MNLLQPVLRSTARGSVVLVVLGVAAVFSAAVVRGQVNVGLAGGGISGHAAADNGTLGVLHANAGVFGNINDNNNTTRVDTFGGGGDLFDFVGVNFLTTSRPASVSAVTLQHAVFFDGGWFGPTAGPGAGGNLAASDLTAPKVQVSMDYGKTWTDVAATNNYLATLTGHPLPAVAFGPPTNPGPVTFTLNTPQANVTGIRLLGDGGGSADGNGFLGIFEFGVQGTPSKTQNLARIGSGITGHVAADNGTLGTPLAHAGAFTAVNDGNAATSIDTYSGGGGLDFVGVTYPSNFAPYMPESVSGVVLHNATFFDGGWFGPNAGPGAGGSLAAGDLTEPKVQVTADGGTTWTDVPFSSNYVAALTGHALPAAFGPPTNPGPVEFTLNTPQTGINGIRLLGDGGGSADGNGFLGVFELEVTGKAPNVVSLASQGATGILGHAAADDGSLGTLHANAGVFGNINDGNLTTRVDSFGGGGPLDFVGVTFDTPQDNISQVVVDMATFFDGGWFGGTAGPGAGGALAASDLEEPKVQITTDGGTTWTDVGFTSDYIDELTGHPLPAVAFGAPTEAVATFNLDELADGVDGIRLLGNGGGSADGNGFIGVFEFAVVQQAQAVPEPTSVLVWLCVGLAGACGGWRRWRRYGCV